MTYRDFTLESIREKFGIANRQVSLFEDLQDVEPSEFLLKLLKRNRKMPIRNEKSRSEWLVAPILSELREINHDYITVFSGDSLNIDKALGLFGECDFMIAKNYDSLTLEAPLFSVVEAKKENFELGTSQCAAQLIAARIFNQKHGQPFTDLYGAITIGDSWLFIKLEGNIILVDNQQYTLRNLPELLGVLQAIINFYNPL